MNFQISGLPIEPFRTLFGQTDAQLAQAGVIRTFADALPGFPCRVSLEDALPGEPVLLLNYVHQPADTPYRAAHAIFVRETATRSARYVNEVPAALRARYLSLRAFDAAGMMTDAELTDGTAIEAVIEQLLADDRVAYVHAHFAQRGCYAARIDRVAGA